VQVDGRLVEDVDELLESLVDEDERDEHREALLRETGDVADEGAQVKRHHQQQDEADPHPDPEPESQVVDRHFPKSVTRCHVTYAMLRHKMRLMRPY